EAANNPEVLELKLRGLLAQGPRAPHGRACLDRASRRYAVGEGAYDLDEHGASEGQQIDEQPRDARLLGHGPAVAQVGRQDLDRPLAERSHDDARAATRLYQTPFGEAAQGLA